MSPASHTFDGLLKEYNILAWKIESELKKFVGELHRQKLIAKAEAPEFEPQEFDIRINDGKFDPPVEGDSKLNDITGDLCKSFNRRFILLFRDILLPQPEAYLSTGCSNRHHENLLWAGILEAEENSNGIGITSSEQLSYSLFCYEHNVPNPEGFFTAHRQYERLANELYSLTNYFLSEGGLANGKATGGKGNGAYKPFYISVFSGETQKALTELNFCHRILQDSSSIVDVCSEFGISTEDERVLKCFKCRDIDKCEYTNITALELDSVFSCSYKPYLSSYGAILREEFVNSIDQVLRSDKTQGVGFLDSKPEVLLSIINNIFEQVKSELKIRNQEDFISDGYISIRSEEDRLENDLKNPDRLKKFINYLIWLRLVGFAGGAEKNWTNYFYFPIPDLSGNYLHTITVASNAPMDALLFHLIDRNAAKLFQRSMLRLTLKERELRKEVESHARRAAVAAVMSRNMSHNIGSHVSPRATLDRVSERLKPIKLSCDERFSVISVLKSKLDEHIQKKADFLAEITTEPLATTKPALFYREIIAPFIQNSLLMDNIAANERITFEDEPSLSSNNLKIRVHSDGKEIRGVFSCQALPGSDGGPCKYFYPEKLPYPLLCEKHKKELVLETISNPEKEIEIELPGPLGEFAFFGILENHIRNAAKHNKDVYQAQGKLEIKVDISEPADEQARLNFYEVRISDNLTKNKSLPSPPGHDEWTLKDQIEAYLAMDIIEDDGRLKREAWGIAEMKICATLLSGSSNFDNMGDSLRVELGSDESIVLVTRVMKSKRVCVVKPSISSDITYDSLKNSGVWVFNGLEELGEFLSPIADAADKKARPVSSFRFAVFDFLNKQPTVEELEVIKNLLPQLPFRILINVSENQASHIEDAFGKGTVLTTQEQLNLPISTDQDPSKAADAIFQWCWRQWVERRFIRQNDDDGMAQLHVFLEQNKDEQPTKTWIEQAKAFNENNRSLTLAVWDNAPTCNASINQHGAHLLYDRHGGILRASDRKPPIVVPLVDFPDGHYYNYLDKGSSDFTLIYSPQFPLAGDTPWPMPWEIAESALLRIIVVDERIAERAFDEISDENIEHLRLELISKFNEQVSRKEYSLPRFHLAWASRVYICTDRVPTNSSDRTTVPLHKSLAGLTSRPKVVFSLDNKTASVEYYSPTDVESDSIKAEMIVIHQGILDDIVKESLSADAFGYADLEAGSEDVDLEAKKKETLKILLKSLHEKFPFVVVDSGRGIPHTLPDKEKFLPFSLVQDYLLGQRISKYSMSRAAMSLTRRRTRSDGN